MIGIDIFDADGPFMWWAVYFQGPIAASEIYPPPRSYVTSGPWLDGTVGQAGQHQGLSEAASWHGAPAASTPPLI